MSVFVSPVLPVITPLMMCTTNTSQNHVLTCSNCCSCIIVTMYSYTAFMYAATLQVFEESGPSSKVRLCIPSSIVIQYEPV